MKHLSTQCRLQRGSVYQTAWIPAKFASTGAYLKIQGENGWQVTSVGTTMRSAIVSGRSNEHRHYRANNDV